MYIRLYSFILISLLISTNLFYKIDIFCQQKFIFSIRIDDIQSRGTQTPKSILKFSEAVAKHKAKITWCVIPHRLIESQNEDGILSREIKETIVKYGFDVYQHGYNHICSKCGSSGHEMVCTTKNYHFNYDEQKTIILSGMKILQDSLNLTPKGFVAPAHVQDSMTFKVLSDFGFKYISFTQPDAVMGAQIFNLSVIPVNIEFTWSLTEQTYTSQMNNALMDIDVMFRKNKYYDLLLHDPFIREGYSNGITIKFIDELLTALESKYKDTLQYMSLTEALDEFNKKTEITLNENKIYYDNISVYPNPFNSNTTISWMQKISGNTSVIIYDTRGSIVLKRDLGYLKPDSYKYSLSLNNLSSGIYYIQIRSERFKKSSKLILMK